MLTIAFIYQQKLPVVYNITLDFKHTDYTFDTVEPFNVHLVRIEIHT